MQFAVGYQQCEDERDPFVGIVADYREHVAEVYFSWVGQASGRAAVGKQRGLVDWTAQARLEEDLRACKALGLKLDLLFNANCYGGRAVSEALENEIGSTLAHLEETVGGVETVTTTSPFIARTIKQHFPEIEVRASVNMRIGSPEAMGMVADLFDSFYLQRDRQRALAYVREVKAWCDEQGKGLCLLANSGCLRNCPGQTFHDNLVAHDAEIDETKNVAGWTPHVCWRLYQDRANRAKVLQSTWIRPEDVRRYEGACHVMKLATRMHQNPRMVLQAYAAGSYPGNLLDLLEPGVGPAFAPWIVDNMRFPADWFERVSTCDGRCTRCAYCETTLQDVLVKIME